MSNITNLIKNEDYTRNFYLAVFKEQEEQFIKSNYSYLKKPHYYMVHYDKAKHSKKKPCSLNETDILNITINDNEYKSIIINALGKNAIPQTPEKLTEILEKYNYPKEFIEKKTHGFYGDIFNLKLKTLFVL